MIRRRLLPHWQDLLILMVALLGVAAYGGAAAQLDQVGFPLDDAWIHQTYARNLAQRFEWAFIPGTPTAASTAPLYTTALAVGYALRVPYFQWTFLVGVFSLAFGGWMARRLASVMFPKLIGAGMWTGLAAVTMWHLVWAGASGMETSLFAALSLALILSAQRALGGADSHSSSQAAARGVLVGLLGAALTATRPEGVGLVSITLTLAVMSWPSGNRRALGAFLAGAGTAYVLAILPYLALNYHMGGSLLPNTSAAKQAEFRVVLTKQPLIERGARLLLPLTASGVLLLVPGMAYALFHEIRRARDDRGRLFFLTPAVWAMVLVAAYALRLPATYQHGRYIIPIVPSLLLFGVGGTLLMARAARRARIGRVLSRTLSISAVLVTAGFWWLGARQYAEDVRIINTEMVATAKWVEENLPPDELLAVHDIGALGYFAPRPIFDLAGLVSPEVVPIINDGAALMRLMCERQARYLMVLPDQLPAPADDPRLGRVKAFDPALGTVVTQAIFRTDSPYASEAAGYPNNMQIYELQWSEPCD